MFLAGSCYWELLMFLCWSDINAATWVKFADSLIDPSYSPMEICLANNTIFKLKNV